MVGPCLHGLDTDADFGETAEDDHQHVQEAGDAGF
jgi:hypothetical protein